MVRFAAGSSPQLANNVRDFVMVFSRSSWARGSQRKATKRKKRKHWKTFSWIAAHDQPRSSWGEALPVRSLWPCTTIEFQGTKWVAPRCSTSAPRAAPDRDFARSRRSNAVAFRVARICHRESPREPVNLAGRLSNFQESPLAKPTRHLRPPVSILFPVCHNSWSTREPSFVNDVSEALTNSL